MILYDEITLVRVACTWLWYLFFWLDERNCAFRDSCYRPVPPGGQDSVDPTRLSRPAFPLGHEGPLNQTKNLTWNWLSAYSCCNHSIFTARMHKIAGLLLTSGFFFLISRGCMPPDPKKGLSFTMQHHFLKLFSPHPGKGTRKVTCL